MGVLLLELTFHYVGHIRMTDDEKGELGEFNIHWTYRKQNGQGDVASQLPDQLARIYSGTRGGRDGEKKKSC